MEGSVTLLTAVQVRGTPRPYRYSPPEGGRPHPRLKENPGIQRASQVQTAVDLLAFARLFRRVLYRTGSERFIEVVLGVVVQTDVLGVVCLATVQ